ncbi:hypothetical protein [Sphingomonas mesophila]|uniref:hypothetical protein n=1 Tax=Sphingomonas mesophila TaxID=2303576 RepID=UPI000E578850|nr:hypothetical protein [Sphingomonas mesophila]
MRALTLLPLLALAACNVSEGNNSVTVSYDQNAAEEAVADVTNGAKEAGAAIANGTEAAVDKAQNVDVDVSVDSNTADNNRAN